MENLTCSRGRNRCQQGGRTSQSPGRWNEELCWGSALHPAMLLVSSAAGSKRDNRTYPPGVPKGEKLPSGGRSQTPNTTTQQLLPMLLLHAAHHFAWW